VQSLLDDDAVGGGGVEGEQVVLVFLGILFEDFHALDVEEGLVYVEIVKGHGGFEEANAWHLVVDMGDPLGVPVGHALDELVLALPHVELLVDQPDAVTAGVLVGAVAGIQDGLVTLEVDLEASDDFEALGGDHEKEASGEEHEVGELVHEFLDVDAGEIRAVAFIEVVGGDLVIVESEATGGEDDVGDFTLLTQIPRLVLGQQELSEHDSLGDVDVRLTSCFLDF
jgi:hypothetical protein